MALLVVLVILLAVTGSSTAFIGFMNRQQAYAGARYRATAAAAVAEAGVHRALGILETVTPDGFPGRTWRPEAYVETLSVGSLEGRFTVSITDGPGGSVVITSIGEIAGSTRRVRARVHLASPALLAALYGASYVRLEQPRAATAILPYREDLRDHPWVHVAAGQGIWFVTPDVSINDPAQRVEAGEGPVDVPPHFLTVQRLPPPGPVRLLLARHAELSINQDLQRVDIQQLRPNGIYVNGTLRRSWDFPASPGVDRAHYKALAAASTLNAGLNAAVGRHVGNPSLARKGDSLYTQAEFEQVLAFLDAGRHRLRLHGVVYVRGSVELSWGRRLQIADGALIVEGAVDVGQGARLEVTHSAATRTLPGIIALEGDLTITQHARLRVHGLVFAEGTIEVSEGAQADIVGSVVGSHPGLSVHNFGAMLIIRYDPAVLGTPAVRAPVGTAIIAWVSSWEELP